MIACPTCGSDPCITPSFCSTARNVDGEDLGRTLTERLAEQRKEQEKRIAELAVKDRVTYDQQRKTAAKELGIRKSTLDEEVRAYRERAKEDAEPSLYPHWAVEPCDGVVDGAVLLQALIRRIQRHVVMQKDQAIAVALWLMMSWVHEMAAIHSPILLVTSAEANSGKSTLLGIIGFLARRALLSVSISGPALFRSIEKWQPAFVVDEGDTVFARNEDLREVFNSGWTRGQSVIRCDPNTHEPRPYSTFAPKALGMKGRKLPDTTLSRAIVVELKRKKPSETAQDFDHIDDEGLATLRRQLARWAEDSTEALARASPEIPGGFHNRVRANWKLLLAIADAAGGDWPRVAREAAERLTGAVDTASIGVELLISIKSILDKEQVFEKGGAACVTSKMMIEKLTADPESRWHEWKGPGKPLTQKQLGRLLSEFGIASETIHPEGAPDARGYKRARFEDAWERYLTGHSPSEASKCPNADEMGTTHDFRSVLDNSKDASKNANLSYSHAGLDAWTDRKPENGAKANMTMTSIDDDPWHIPPALDRRRPAVERLGPPAISAGPDDDLGDLR